MEIYKLSKFISISSDLATVEMISEKDSIYTTLQRTKCFLNREYAKIKNKWFCLSKYTVRINNISYHNSENGYTIASVDILKNHKKEDIPTDIPKIKGFFSFLYKEEEVDVLGYWESSTYGLYFNVLSHKRITKIDSVAVKNYIKAALPNISTNMIENMIKYFGPSKILDIIKNTPEELKKVKGIGDKSIQKITDGIGQARVLESVFDFLSRFDIPSSLIIQIYKEIGLNTEDIIKNNPYKLVENMLLDINSADKIGKHLGFSYNSHERIKALVVCFLKNESENKGDMFTKFDLIASLLDSYSAKYGDITSTIPFTPKEIFKAIQELSKDGYVFIEDHPSDGICIYHSYYKTVEDKICNRLYELLTTFSKRKYFPDKVNDVIINLEKTSGIKMAKLQKEAVHMAIKYKFSILTGGPGTGKTQTINTIIKTIKSIYPDCEIGLCAPTGKASKRMSEMTGLEAYTIHKKLKCTPFTNVMDLEELTADFIIIDEASMIDADLFYKLLTTIKDDASILFVGDYNQLPSVGVGLILRDLIESNSIPVTQLIEVFRQKGESPIIELSQEISKGNHLRKNSKYITSKKDFHFSIKNTNQEIQDEILNTIKKAINSKIISADSIQVLMPLNHGDVGMVILNQKIQSLLNPDKGQAKYELTPFMEIREGDRVMQTKNNYDVGVFNGSVGYVKKIFYNNDVEVICEFDGEEKTYVGDDAVQELVLAYAITIHKSQGSEFQMVIMPVSKSYHSMLSRNLLYTAVTRAKKYLRIIGDIDSFNNGIDNTEVVSRNSHIKERLIKLLK